MEISAVPINRFLDEIDSMQHDIEEFEAIIEALNDPSSQIKITTTKGEHITIILGIEQLDPLRDSYKHELDIMVNRMNPMLDVLAKINSLASKWV